MNNDIFIDSSSTIESTMRLLDKKNFGTLFVIKDKKLLGVITEGDIRRAILRGVDKKHCIIDIMNKNPITDIDTAKSRINKTNASFIIVPLFNKNGDVSGYTKVSNTNKSVIDKRILIIGGAGYLGSVVCRKFLNKGYRVRVLDCLLYGDKGIKDLYGIPSFEFVYGDFRNIQILVDAIKDVDVVILLAAVVGDPACMIDTEDTIQSNLFACKMVADVCKFSQINRLIFASTCSVYGASVHNVLLNENSELNPVSLYARIKLSVERSILDMIDDNFKPTIFRMATLHGVSPRMRFDLAVNIMTANALFEKKIVVNGGSQMRAFCHVEDAANAYVKCIETNINNVAGKIFNIVSENFSIDEVADKIENIISDVSIVKEDVVDKRDYIVDGKFGVETMNLVYRLGINDTINAIVSLGDYFKDYKDKKYSNVDFIQICKSKKKPRYLDCEKRYYEEGIE